MPALGRFGIGGSPGPTAGKPPGSGTRFSIDLHRNPLGIANVVVVLTPLHPGGFNGRMLSYSCRSAGLVATGR